jgi:hypothetical protein
MCLRAKEYAYYRQINQRLTAQSQYTSLNNTIDKKAHPLFTCTNRNKWLKPVGINKQQNRHTGVDEDTCKVGSFIYDSVIGFDTTSSSQKVKVLNV